MSSDDALIEAMTRAIDPVAWAEHRMGMEGWDGRRSDSILSARAALAAYRKIEGDRIAALEAALQEARTNSMSNWGQRERADAAESRVAELEAEIREYERTNGELGRMAGRDVLRIAALAQRCEALEEGLRDVGASLVAALSILNRARESNVAPNYAVASDKMFSQMLRDYEASLDRARALLGGSNAAQEKDG